MYIAVYIDPGNSEKGAFCERRFCNKLSVFNTGSWFNSAPGTILTVSVEDAILAVELNLPLRSIRSIRVRNYFRVAGQPEITAQWFTSKSEGGQGERGRL